MGMVSYLKGLFRPDNSRIDAAMARVNLGAANVERSANRLHATLAEMLDKNDTLTFRGKNNNGKSN